MKGVSCVYQMFFGFDCLARERFTFANVSTP